MIPFWLYVLLRLFGGVRCDPHGHFPWVSIYIGPIEVFSCPCMVDGWACSSDIVRDFYLPLWTVRGTEVRLDVDDVISGKTTAADVEGIEGEPFEFDLVLVVKWWALRTKWAGILNCWRQHKVNRACGQLGMVDQTWWEEADCRLAMWRSS